MHRQIILGCLPYLLLILISVLGSQRLQRSLWNEHPTVLRAGRTLEDVRRMADDVSLLQRLPQESRPTLEAVAPLQADPVLAWYLRRIEGLRWVALPSLSPPTSADLLVATVEPFAIIESSALTAPQQYPLRYRRSGELEVVRLRRISAGFGDP